MITVILLAYAPFLIIGLMDKKVGRKLKVWMVVGVLAIAGLSSFALSSSQPVDKVDSLENEIGPAHSKNAPSDHQAY